MSDNFTGNFLRHTSIYESPTSFWKWAAYATIAAAVKDSCWVAQGDRKLYPNIYVLFLAESSGYRKGPPIDLSETLITKVNNTKVISGRSSIEAVLDELARAETDKKTGKVNRSGSAVFYAPEMAAGIVSNMDALKILTDIYDYKTNPYKQRLRTGPCFNLERISLCMLSGSNEAMLKNLFGIAEVQGGFLARTFLVTPDEMREPNSLMRIDIEERKISLAKVQDKLREVAELKGIMTIEDDAIQEYEDWYGPFRKAYLTKKEASGIVGRIHTSVVKLSMIMALNKLRLNIHRSDIEEAIAECLSLLPNYSVFTLTQGKSEATQLYGKVMTLLLMAKNYRMKSKEILRETLPEGMTAELFDKLIVSLEQAGMVVREYGTGKDKAEEIVMTKACLERMGR